MTLPKTEIHECRVVKVLVCPVGKPTYCEEGFTIEIDDESGGEYIVLRSNIGGEIRIDVAEWEFLRESIDMMAKECRK